MNMKKFFSVFAVAVLAVCLTACGGNAANNNSSSASDAEGEAPALEETAAAEAQEVAGEQDILAQYETLINKTIELQGKVREGDAEAMQEYSELAEKLVPLAEQLAQEFANMTPEQIQHYTKLAQKLAEAATAQ
ncbi:MAG: hypothetical protein LUD68_04765 [Rikenellaceae bacterium]|nr:hypothetical protein [Rikenellaceae bacterium]